MKTLLKILAYLAIITVAIGAAYAQFSKPEEAIRYRKSVMFLNAQHFGRMGTMVKEKTLYNKEVFTDNAVVVETLSRLPWEALMMPGTDKGDTKLKSSVFEQKAKFNELARDFERQTSKLVSTAKSGDFNSIKTQFGEVAKSCKACHNQFKNK